MTAAALCELTDDLERRGVSVDVDQTPERPGHVHAGEEDALLLVVEAEVDVAAGSDVVEEHAAGLGVPLRHRLGPEAGPTGQVCGKGRVVSQAFNKTPTVNVPISGMTL